MLIPSSADLTAGFVAPDEQQFLKALGTRITKLRKEQGLSQQSVADTLGMAQQSYAHYEVGRVRMPLWILPQIAQLFGVSADELIGVHKNGTGKRGPAPQLQQKIERLTHLPRAQQKLVMQMLDGVLSQASR